MAFSRQFVTLAVCALCAVAVSASQYLAPGVYPAASLAYPAVPQATKNQSVIIGTVGWQDKLLLQETAFKKGTMLIVSDKDILFPKKGAQNAIISCIKILDQQLDGKNGEVKVKEGGVGSRNVLLRFHSLRGKGLHYLVEIYGH